MKFVLAFALLATACAVDVKPIRLPAPPSVVDMRPEIVPQEVMEAVKRAAMDAPVDAVRVVDSFDAEDFAVKIVDQAVSSDSADSVVIVNEAAQAVDNKVNIVDSPVQDMPAPVALPKADTVMIVESAQEQAPTPILIKQYPDPTWR